MLEWRLKSYRHWLTMKEPSWAQSTTRPLTTRTLFITRLLESKDSPKSLDEVDPELLKTYEKLGIPLREQERLSRCGC